MMKIKFTGFQFLAVNAFGCVELHQDQVLGHDKVGEGVSVQDRNSLFGGDVVVALGGLERVDGVFQLSVVGAELGISGPVIATAKDAGHHDQQGQGQNLKSSHPRKKQFLKPEQKRNHSAFIFVC